MLSLLFGILLFIVCPLLFPTIGEQQNSYVQELCFTAFVWIALGYKWLQRKGPVTLRLLDIAIGICLFALLLHSVWIKPVGLSVWRWIDIAGLTGLYLLIRCSSHADVRLLLSCVMISGLLQCLYAGMQGTGLLPSLHSASPMTGSFLNPAPLAGYLAVFACMVAATLFWGRLRGKRRKMAWGIMTVFVSFVLMLNSRAALFALIVVVVGLAYSRLSRLESKRKRLYAVILIVGLGLSLYGLYQIREVSANGRLFIWKNTCEMIKDHPFTGVGIDRFKVEFPAYQAQYHRLQQEVPEKYYDGNTFLVFNEYLRAVAETGFLLPLLFLFPIGVVYSSRKRSPECRAAVSGIAGILVFGCFSYPFSVFTLEVLTVLLLGIIGRESRVVYSWDRVKCFEMMIAGTTVASIAFTLYGLKVVSVWNAHEQKYEEYAFWFRDNITFVRRHCHETLERGDTIQALCILDKAIDRIPVAGFYQQRARLYVETGDCQKAENDYLFLRYLAPTSWDTVLELARLYRKMDRNREALDLLEPYTKLSPKEKTLEQKAVLLEMRELYSELQKCCNSE